MYILILKKNEKNAIHNMFMVLPVAKTAIALFLISTILSMSIFTNVSVFALSEGMNQTIQNKGQSTNQTGETTKENVSDIVSNISKEAKGIGSNITTEVAKDVAANIGKQLQDLAK
jgi:hypothetical protein